MITTQLSNHLRDYQQKQLYRQRRARSPEDTLINFSSNDYLGLSQHPAIIKTLQQAAALYGVGSGASQLVSGYTIAHQECEAAFADFLRRERALLFGNGFMANLGVIDVLTKRNDYIYEDRHNHASLLDGARLSNAQLVRYKHGNITDLAERITTQKSGNKLVVSDGVFSMYGDIAPVNQLATLCQKINGTLMIDDAHGIGVLGENGRGTLEHFSLSQADVPILICPLGKAFGSYGAIVAGNNELIENLIQFARSYIYTTALPPALASVAMKSLEILQQESWRRQQLHHLIHFFRHAAKQRDIKLLDSETAIQAIVMDTPATALAISKQLQKQGFWVYPMRPPTVPEGQSLLRITLNTMHNETQIIKLLDAM